MATIRIAVVASWAMHNPDVGSPDFMRCNKKYSSVSTITPDSDPMTPDIWEPVFTYPKTPPAIRIKP